MNNFTENRRVPPYPPHYMLGQRWSAVEELQFVDPVYGQLKGNGCGELVCSL